MKSVSYRAHLVAALCASLVSVTPALASEGAPVEAPAAERFEGLLQAIDVVPASAAALLQAFPDIRARLESASLDAKRDEWTRQRAISFLSFFPDSASRDVLVRVAADVTPSLRALAIYTLGRTYGPQLTTLPPEVLAVLKRGLNDDRVEVQERTVRALRWVTDPQAENLLKLAMQRAPLKTLAAATLSKRTARLKNAR